MFVDIDVDHRIGLMRSHTSVHILNAIISSYLVVTCQTSSRVKKDLMMFKFALFGQKFTEKGTDNLNYFSNKMIFQFKIFL